MLPDTFNMVIFYKNSIIKSEPVVISSPHLHSILFHKSETWCCLSCVQNLCLKPLYFLHIHMCQGSNAGEALKYVEAYPLSFQNRACSSLIVQQSHYLFQPLILHDIRALTPLKNQEHEKPPGQRGNLPEQTVPWQCTSPLIDSFQVSVKMS